MCRTSRSNLTLMPSRLYPFWSYRSFWSCRSPFISIMPYKVAVGLVGRTKDFMMNFLTYLRWKWRHSWKDEIFGAAAWEQKRRARFCWEVAPSVGYQTGKNNGVCFWCPTLTRSPNEWRCFNAVVRICIWFLGLCEVSKYVTQKRMEGVFCGLSYICISSSMDDSCTGRYHRHISTERRLLSLDLSTCERTRGGRRHCW
jgi:hypothetical protein